jgi:glucan phosphoethanolaminetransferase (alkaline phosphatase superfamily)
MTKQELFEKVTAAKTETKNALQEVYNELNNGQQKKLLKNENIKALFERYGVEV